MSRQSTLIYPELSYKIVGLLYGVYNDLGFGYQEKYYQRAFAQALRDSGINFRKEQPYPITYKKGPIGRYFIDFVVEDKVAVEIKIAKTVYDRHLAQLLAYLKHAGLPLGLLAVFSDNDVVVKRVANTQ